MFEPFTGRVITGSYGGVRERRFRKVKRGGRSRQKRKITSKRLKKARRKIREWEIELPDEQKLKTDYTTVKGLELTAASYCGRCKREEV